MNVNQTHTSACSPLKMETFTKNDHFLSSLYTIDTNGNYVMASDCQILDEAIRAIDCRHPTGTAFSSSAISSEYFRAKLAGREREIFAVAFLNNQHQLLAYRELFQGSIRTVEVHPREIAKEAMFLNASAVILGHNHPSYSPEPSQADKAITSRIVDALAVLDVRVIDHLIVAGNEVTSFAERGLVSS